MHFLPKGSRVRDDLRISSGLENCDQVDLGDITQY